MAQEEAATETEGEGGRRGSVGRETYERVRGLIESGMSRTAAFAQVGADTGRSPGTVATAFYRVARQQPDGGGVRQRPRRTRTSAGAGQSATSGSSGRSSRRAAAASPSADNLVADIHRLVDQLAQQLRDLDGEVRELREQAARYDQVRRLFAQ